MTYSMLQLDDAERIELGGAGWWRPIRRALGATAFGVNAYTADSAGDALIETHDETSFGRAGAALPVSPYEHWYAAEPAYQAGDYAHAVAIASEGLADWPEHPSLHYQLACYEALGGNRERAIEHLKVAYARNPATREWAADDDDLASVRDDPALR